VNTLPDLNPRARGPWAPTAIEELFARFERVMDLAIRDVQFFRAMALGGWGAVLGNYLGELGRNIAGHKPVWVAAPNILMLVLTVIFLVAIIRRPPGGIKRPDL
jgi:hypothetical protein